MKRIIAIGLALLMILLCLVGCATNDPLVEETEESNEVTTEKDDFPDIPKQDNGGIEFNILYPGMQMYVDGYYFSEGINGDVVGDEAYARLKMVEDHLGITIVPILTTNDVFSGIQDVMDKVRISGMTGTDDYQMVLTHCFHGVTANATMGYFTDYRDIPNINLDAKYWRKSQMDFISIDGAMYFGKGSFVIPDPSVILFNKDLVDKYQGISVEALYQSVRDKTWTIEKMKQYASVVTEEDQYGFVTVGNWHLIGLMASDGYYTATKNSENKFELLDFNNHIYNICTSVKSLYDAEYSAWISDASAKMTTGKAMFSTEGLSTSITVLANSRSNLGILPYPSVSEGREQQNLDWSGYMVIPSTVQNKNLVGSVSELLCYYGEKNVYPAFFEKLLGARAAHSLEDFEMLDLIFDNMVQDPALPFSNGSMTHFGYLFYIIPETVEAEGQLSIASYFEQHYTPAKSQLVLDVKK